MQAVGSRALKPGLESFEHLDISGTKKDLFEQFIWLHGLSEFVFVKSTNSASALAPFTLLPLMEIAHYILCISYALNLVSCSDIFLIDTDGPYRFVSEDAGATVIRIASRATQDREAYIFFHTNNTYVYILYDVPVHYAIAGVDFEFQTISNETRYFDFTIPAGGTRSFQMTIIDDTIAEVFSADFIEYDIGIYNNSGERVFYQQQIIYIEDNDGLRFETVYEGFTVDETVGSTELCVSYRGDNVPPVIDATMIPDAHDDEDLLFSETNFTISTGSRRCLNVMIVDDDKIERPEYFGFHVHLQTRVDPHFSDFTQINIRDNDAFRIGFERSNYSVLESDELLSVCVTADRGDGSEAYLVNLTSIDLTAQGETDYGSVKQQLIVSAEHNRPCININVTDDILTEESESFQLSLVPVLRTETSNEVFQVHNDLVTITILDDDIPCSPDCVHGVCVYPAVCQCDTGWINDDCSRAITPSAVASFSDTSCKVDGACPNDPLHFTCEVNEVSILRVVLPSGEQETITVGDEVDRIPLPAGFTAVSLDITDIFGSIRNFVLTLSIASASLLAGGKIRCDDGSGNITATAGCVLVEPPLAPSNLMQIQSSNTLTTATITWDPTGTGDTYTVLSSSAVSPLSALTQPSLTLTGLVIETDYVVSVTATNECSIEGPPSDEITVRIGAREPLPPVIQDPVIQCDTINDERKTMVNVTWTVADTSTMPSSDGIVTAPVTHFTVFYTDPVTGVNVTTCTTGYSREITVFCYFLLPLTEADSLVEVFVNVSSIAGYSISARTFASEVLTVEHFLDVSAAPPYGMSVTLNPLCAKPTTDLFVQGRFGVKKPTDDECTYLQSSTQSFTDSSVIFIELDLTRGASDYEYCARAILNGREKINININDVFQNECGDDSNDVDDLSAGSVAGMTAAIVLLISMPVGMAIGLYVARCVWRRGSRGPPSSFLRRGETGSQQKMDKYEEAIYEEPMQVISPINLNENQAYSLIGMQRRN